MSRLQTEIAERQRRLHKLLKGEKFTYWQSNENRMSYGVVFKTARDLSDSGHIQINQRKNQTTGVTDYMATGLLTENRKRKAKGQRDDKG